MAHLFQIAVDPLAPLWSVLGEWSAVLSDVHRHAQLAAIGDGPVQGGGVHGVAHLSGAPVPSALRLQIQPHDASAKMQL